MTCIERAEATKRIKTALKKATGRTWRVYGDSGTAYGWITVTAPKDRCDEPEFGGYMREDDREILGRIFHAGRRAAHMQGFVVSPDNREWAIATAEEAAR